MQYTAEQQEVLEKFKKALAKNKVAMMKDPKMVFFTAVCLNLWHKPEFSIQTAATDGLSVYFNPVFWLSMPPEEQVGVLVHETMHVAYMHMVRLNGRDKEVFNQAADHVINLQILAAGLKLPDFALKDERFRGMGVERVYDILMAEKKAAGGLPSNQLGNDLLPAPPGMTPEVAKAKIESILVSAKVIAEQSPNGIGSIPGDIQIMLERLLQPKLRWQDLLRRYLGAYAKDDYSWRRPNRRFFPTHILPGMHSEKLGTLAVAVDTSGSVSDYDFQVMVSEIAGIFKMMKPELITLLQFDTRVHTITPLKSVSELARCQFTGRGGTRVNEVLEWADKHKPQCLLMFTDGGFHYSGTPSKHIQNNTFWIIHNNPHFTAPFGRTVYYQIGG